MRKMILSLLCIGLYFAQSKAVAQSVDITDYPGTISTQYSDSPNNEAIGNLIDGSSSTKFLTFHGTAWVQFRSTTAAVITSYSLTSANDFAARDPLNWTLQGSNNGTSWTTIDSRNGVDFPNRFQKKTFSFSNSTAYTYFRLNMVNNGDGALQLAELELIGTFEQTDITNLGGTISAQYSDSPNNEDISKLIDNSSSTKYLTFHQSAWVQFQASGSPVVSAYTLTSANDAAARDPLNWTLQGSNNGSSWTTLDSRNGIDFPNRFQKKTFSFSNSTSYTYYRLNMVNNGAGATQLAEWELLGTVSDDLSDWQYFTYPTVVFDNQAAGTTGSNIVNTAMPNMDQVLREMTLIICQKIYEDNLDARVNFTKLNLILSDFDGVAYKSGSPPEISITVSSRYMESYYNSHNQDYGAVEAELRGILAHEGTHGYQWEPKNAGGYTPGTDFYGFIEGLADYVRINTYGFSPQRYPSPGGSWTDGYTRSGFFLDWIADNKDPDFAIKFNQSARDYSNWSWNTACQNILGEGVQSLWNQYQASLSNNIVSTSTDIVYPNPAANEISVKSGESATLQAVDIYSGTEKVISKDLSDNKLNETKMNIQDLPKGYYILVIKKSDGSIEKRKFLKQ
ncbi:basic secretory protein-like protein [Fulvivirga ligni]|uniref:basic secretory protein-like protein n=1 Tax=Fulvivirga ligni TaxID=2904246 RepID=UPI001F189EE8|nr:basic secretory protein-like protein [Fulvivirga ligni]UII23845.1 discoidin domain-containing protein [Fulvivirga ligni]